MRVFSFLLVGKLAVATVVAQHSILKEEFIFTKAPFPRCHASTIVETASGLIAAWFGGTGEKNRDVGIWLSRHVDGVWTPPVEVANGVQNDKLRYPTWNPVLFQPKDGPLMLFFKVGPDPRKWWGELITSTDSGRTWSPTMRLPNGGIGPVKNKPLQLADGTILCGSSSEHAGWRVHFEATRDFGRTWSVIGPINDGRKFSAIQPSILQHGNGRLQALGRSRQKAIFQVWSEDSGKTWGKMGGTGLPNPSSGTDAVTLSDGRHLLVYNHTRRGRSPLNVAVSVDGKDWRAALVLEDTPGEFSYPAVIQSGDGKVHITHTWKRRRIKHSVIDPARFQTRPIKNGHWPD